MKQFMICALGLAAGSLFAAEVACKPHITDPRWSKSADGKAYTVNYDGKNYPLLEIPLTTKPDTFYRATFEVDASEKPSCCNFRYERMDQKKNAHAMTPAGTHKRTETYYFYSGTSTKGSLRFNMDPKLKSMVFTLRNFKLESLDSLEAQGNLIPDPEFENEAVTSFWRDGKSNLLPFADGGFISGSRSLRLDIGKNRVVQSANLPVMPGKKYEFSFFAKADKKVPSWVVFSMWAPFGHTGKHLWLKQDAGFTTEWKEFKFVFTIPTDEKLYPDLRDRIGTLSFSVGKNVDTATVFFDKMSFKEIK